MELDKLLQRQSDRFYLRRDRDTDHFGALIGEFLKTDPTGVRRWGFIGSTNTGKSEIIASVKGTFGRQVSYEWNVKGRPGSAQSLLKFPDTVGWVRHFDASLMVDPETTLKASKNPNFWQDRKVGMDLIEHPNYLGFKAQDQNFEGISKIERAPRTILGRPLIPDFSRVATLYADPKYDDNPAYQALLQRLHEKFPMPSALQAAVEPEVM